MQREPLQEFDTRVLRWKAWTSAACSVLVWLLLGACLTMIFIGGEYQWDLQVYHAAPLALDRQVDPYGMPSLITEIPNGFSYLYPPVLLYVFKPLGAVSLETAMAIWFFLKMTVLAILFCLWHRKFERLSIAWPTVLFLILAFNSTILLDLAAGNIATFETLCLWGAFALLLGGRPYAAGIIIAVISQFKLSPVLFLGVLPFIGPARGWKPFFVSATVFAGLLVLNPLLLPEMTEQFVRSFSSGNPNLDEYGQVNPSTLSFLRLMIEISTHNGLPLPRFIADVGYVLIVATMLLSALWLVRRHPEKLRNADQRWLIYLACVVFSLVAPRMKDYSYVLLLIPALHVVRYASAQAKFPLVAALALLPGSYTYLPVIGRLFTLLHSYLPWFTAWLLLYYLVREIWTGGTSTDRNSSSSKAGENAQVSALLHSR